MNLSVNDKRILQQFFTGKPVKRAYLFGSYARNEASEHSDIDLLVELDYTKHIGYGFIQMVLDLEQLMHRKVDIVTVDGLSKYAKPFVDKDKILIYEGTA
jgi:predicted nucleotidyltransferase